MPRCLLIHFPQRPNKIVKKPQSILMHGFKGYLTCSNYLCSLLAKHRNCQCLCPWRKWSVQKISSKHEPTVNTKGRLHKKFTVSLPKFPLDLPQISMYFTSLAPVKIINRWAFRQRRADVPSHRWSASHVVVMARPVMTVVYKNSGTQGSSASIALCLELTLFQDGFPS